VLFHTTQRERDACSESTRTPHQRSDVYRLVDPQAVVAVLGFVFERLLTHLYNRLTQRPNGVLPEKFVRGTEVLFRVLICAFHSVGTKRVVNFNERLGIDQFETGLFAENLRWVGYLGFVEPGATCDGLVG
jgi:hypothetical protein